MRLAARVLAITVVCAAAGACHDIPHEPLILEGNLLTVDNRTSQDWTHVEIWLNYYYRMPVASIPAHSRFQAPLDTFVAGFGQRFNRKRTQVTDLRLKATLPDGKPLELTKAFTSTGLGAALGGKR